jgi:hypothetical protein
MNQNPDITGAILDCAIIAGGLVLIFGTFDKKCIRARWANGLLITAGLLGIASHLVRLPLHMHWLILSRQVADPIILTVSFANGIIFGFLLALVCSGQTRGIKRE